MQERWLGKKLLRIVEKFNELALISVPQFEASISKRLGPKAQVGISRFLSFTANRFPFILRLVIPKQFLNLLAGYLLINNRGRKKIEPWLKYAMTRKSGTKLTFSYLAQLYLELNLNQELDELLNPESNQWNTPLSDRSRYIRSWSFWRLNHKENSYVQTRLKSLIENEDFEINEEEPRLLPEHTTNMGHLGCLYLYIKYYSAVQPNRQIVIWPEISPNSLYLSKLIESSDLNIHTRSGRPKIESLNQFRVDNLLMSREKRGSWRFEANGAAGTGQSFPEYETDSRFTLRLSKTESDAAVRLLESQGFDLSRWFVILHIREDSRGYTFGGQARDAEITNYSELVKMIDDLGGQIVRMGNNSFPPVKFQVPMFDYAHTKMRTELIDCWLWENCRWWMGNANGASFAVLGFNKPRIITDQWFWDANGRSHDLFIPKLAVDRESGIPLSPKELMNHPSSRCMDRLEIFKSGIYVDNNNPAIIADASREMFEKLRGSLRSETYSPLELQIYDSIKVPENSPRMRLPKAFVNEYSEILLS